MNSDSIIPTNVKTEEVIEKEFFEHMFRVTKTWLQEHPHHINEDLRQLVAQIYTKICEKLFDVPPSYKISANDTWSILLFVNQHYPKIEKYAPELWCFIKACYKARNVEKMRNILMKEAKQASDHQFDLNAPVSIGKVETIKPQEMSTKQAEDLAKETPLPPSKMLESLKHLKESSEENVLEGDDRIAYIIYNTKEAKKIAVLKDGRHFPIKNKDDEKVCDDIIADLDDEDDEDDDEDFQVVEHTRDPLEIDDDDDDDENEHIVQKSLKRARTN